MKEHFNDIVYSVVHCKRCGLNNNIITIINIISCGSSACIQETYTVGHYSIKRNVVSCMNMSWQRYILHVFVMIYKYELDPLIVLETVGGEASISTSWFQTVISQGDLEKVGFTQFQPVGFRQ